MKFGERLFQTKLLSRLSHKVCRLLSSSALFRKFTIVLIGTPKNATHIYRRILVYTFCLINIRLSSSDEANKITPLNIEKKNNFSHLCKFEPEKPNSFREILFEKSQYLQRMHELINSFATQQFHSFKLLLFPFVIDYKEAKLAQSTQIDQLFQLLNLIITNYLYTTTSSMLGYLVC